MKANDHVSLNLNEISVPTTLHDMISLYKYFKRMAFENWCVLRYKDAFREKNIFLQQINALAANNSSKNCVKVCIGAVVLAQYSITFRNDCNRLLKNIDPPKEAVCSQFISIYVAKHANRFRSSSEFVISLLQNIPNMLKIDKQKLYAKNLLYNLAAHATRAIDKCTSKFYNVLFVAFSSPSYDIRIGARKTLNKYFELTKQKLHSRNLYTKAFSLINSIYPAEQHGGILLLTSLIDFFPDYKLESYDIEYVKKKTNEIIKTDIKMNKSCYMLQIALSSNYPETYTDLVTNILKQIWPVDINKFPPESIGIITFMLHKLPQILIPKIDPMLTLIKNRLYFCDNKSIRQGSKLLIEFMVHLPNEFDKYASRIAQILLKAPYTEDFVPVFKRIITTHDSVWNALHSNIASLLIQLLDEGKSAIAVKLIPILPDLPKDHVSTLLQRIQSLLSENDINLKRLVPNALTTLFNFLPSQRFVHSVTALITSAIIEDSWIMRLSILKSFKPPYPNFLAHPNVLEHFSVLLNDESYKVRRAALRILGGVSQMNPAMIYPMFRRILLDILFLCGASKSMRVQSDATLCLPIIFSMAVPILPIYVPVFLPIAMQYLTEHLSKSANEIDDPHNLKVVSDYQTNQMSFGSIQSISKTPLLNSISTSFDSKQQLNRSGSYSSIKSLGESSSPKLIIEERMTFFERIFATKIAVNFIKSIGCICEKSFYLIQPNIEEITSLLLETIGRAAHKTVLLASIETLGKIVDQLGPLEAAKIPDLNSTLLKLGSRIISSKVYTAIFKLLGKIGPITPQSSLNIMISEVKAPENFDLLLPLEDFIVRSVVTTLFFVLDDKSEAPLHCDAHRALSLTFATCTKSVNSQNLFKSYIVRLLTTMRALTPDERPLYFQFISTILKCPMEWLQPFSGHFFQLIEDLWDTENNEYVISIIPKLAASIKDEFSPYMPRALSLLLDYLASYSSHTNYSHNDSKTQLILKTLAELSKYASNFIFIIISQICDTITKSKVSNTVISQALSTIRSLTQNYNCGPYSSLIVRTCLFVLQINSNMKEYVLQVLYSLAVTMGPKFSNYIQALNTKECDLFTEKMALITTKNTKCKLSDFPFIIVDQDSENNDLDWTPNTTIDESELTNATTISSMNETNEQWKSWIRTFIQAFIKHSPIPAIQSCIPIAEQSVLFSRKIFNPAFLSCWSRLTDPTRMSIQASISQALAPETSTPSSVVTALIGVVEFCDRARMPIEGNYFNRTKSALNAGKRTFALYCAQMDFYSHPKYSALNLELLNQIYSQLGMFDEAHEIKKIADGLTKIEKFDSTLNRLENSEEWKKIEEHFSTFSSLPESEKRSSGVLFAHAFWHLKQWENFESSIIPCKDSTTAIIMRCLHDLYFKKNINDLINEGFVKLGQQGGPLFLHGFTAVAPYIVNAQQLVEIQEFANFLYSKDKDSNYGPKTIEEIRKIWQERLTVLNCNFNTIRPLLHTRIDMCSMLPSSSNESLLIKLSFLKLARKASEWDAFEHFFNLHFSKNSEEIHVKYEYLHLLKKKSTDSAAIEFLDKVISQPPNNNEHEIYAKFFFKKAKWIARENIPNNNESNKNKYNSKMNDSYNELIYHQLSKVIELCEKSMNIKPHHYHAKNLWAWANMKLLYMNINDPSMYAINAITGFADCVQMDYQNAFFDLLQMLSILFRSTNIPNLFDRIKYVKDIEYKKFIKVIPQLLVYQYTHSESHKDFLRNILNELLNNFPNSVIFPLLFVKNFGKDNIGVKEILLQFSHVNCIIYHAAVKVLDGLQAVSCLFTEFVYNCINTIGCRIGANSSPEILLPICNQFISRIDQINSTTNKSEIDIFQRYHVHLKYFYDSFKKYIQVKSLEVFPKNIDFKNLLSAFKKEMLSESHISIKNVAPALSMLPDQQDEVKNPHISQNFQNISTRSNVQFLRQKQTQQSKPQWCSQLAVFNTFEPDKPIVSIAKFCDSVTIKPTKQRPRKLKIIGSNGKAYKFLLKNGDLRIEQRMMQFFDLMNSLTSSSMPKIIITGITPLTPEVGLMQWLQKCDTIHELIAEMRAIDGNTLDLECQMMSKLSYLEIDKLSRFQRLELLTQIASETPDSDLRNIMWLKAQDAESWVRHTSNFSKTSSLMSIVGYIIGLGDRHPANIMIQRYSGNVIHIDFGDCFEVNKERAQLAETVPFRLTRMMIGAFGPCGIEGSFRRTCEQTVQIIREHREAVMSILEIFIREPCKLGGVFDSIDEKNVVSGSVTLDQWMNETDGQKALKKMISTISKKVNGLDFGNDIPLSASEQVDKLIVQATDMYNLANLYHGWNPLW